jgi:polyisoprenoid-binding protein YceI
LQFLPSRLGTMTLHETVKKRFRSTMLLGIFLLLAGLLTAQSPAPAQELVLQLDPARSGAEITLPATMHTVDGRFAAKRGTIHFDPASGRADGEVVFDAASGNTGNDGRDHKMHHDVLESQRYPEIVFRPDHAEGAFTASGTSTLQVHGRFGIHGAEHEITIPVEVSFAGNAWTAKASFRVPYIKWGLKNPSTFFLRVADSVAVRVHATGSAAP